MSVVEDWLAAANDSLADAERSVRLTEQEQFPIIHVVGAPRSGTTLLTQVLARHLDLAYVSNIAARFYRAPLFGQRLARDILGVDYAPSALESRYGRSTGADGPHEFGQFWRDIFGAESMNQVSAVKATVDWDTMIRVLTNITAYEDRALIVKNLIGVWRLRETKSKMPQTGVVKIVRDTADNAASLLRLRCHLNGSIGSWASVRPQTCSDMEDWTACEQVVLQVLEFNREIERQIAGFGDDVVRVSYEQLCADPESVVHATAGLLVRLGWAPLLRNGPPEPQQIRSRDHDSWSDQIRQAVDDLT